MSTHLPGRRHGQPCTALWVRRCSRSPPPHPPLRSLVVPVVGSALGLLVPSGPSVPAPGGSDWQTKRNRRDQPSPPRPVARCTLPSTRPPPNSRLLADLFCCCYNCGLPHHISRECTNPPVCVRGGGEGHISSGCHLPRGSSSSGANSSRAPSPIRRRISPPVAVLPPVAWLALPTPAGGSLLSPPRASPARCRSCGPIMEQGRQ